MLLFLGLPHHKLLLSSAIFPNMKAQVHTKSQTRLHDSCQDNQTGIEVVDQLSGSAFMHYRSQNSEIKVLKNLQALYSVPFPAGMKHYEQLTEVHSDSGFHRDESITPQKYGKQAAIDGSSNGRELTSWTTSRNQRVN
ncbi:hypothetical protein STEG23_006302 [Scotinomys teguina]